jgi:L-fucose isomerase
MMRNKSYLACGTSSMGIAGSFVDPDFFQDYFGMRTEQVDMCEFERRIEQGIYDKAEYERALAWTRKNCKEGKDWNAKAIQKPRNAKDADWSYVVKMALVMRDLMVGNPALAKQFPEESLGRNALVSGFQGQRQWTDYRPNGDFLEAILTSSFDWNGIRAPYLVATENDSLNGACMLLMYLLTNRAQLFADVRTYWSHLINSGAACLDGSGKQRIKGKPAMKPFWDIAEKEAAACLKATEWCPADVGYFRGGGFSSSFLTEGGMPMTMTRISRVKGFGPVLQIAEGWSSDLPKHVNDKLMERTNPTWPCTWFVPRLTGSGAFRDVYSVMNNWSANHGAISYGHIGADLTTLAAMLRIPVAMSNVAEEDVFRPHAWGLFGASDLTGSDYRACQHFGPIYK